MPSPDEEIDDVIDIEISDDKSDEIKDDFIVDAIPEGEEEVELTYTNRWMTWELADSLTQEQLLDYYNNRMKKKFANKISIEKKDTKSYSTITLKKWNTVAWHHQNNTINFIKAPIKSSELKKIYNFLTSFYEDILGRKLLFPLMSTSTRVSFKGFFEQMLPLDMIKVKAEKFLSYESEFTEYDPELSIKQFILRSKSKNITLLIPASGSFTGISPASEEDIQEYVNRVYYSIKK